MTRRAKDEEREARIHMEIVVDAYGPEERAIGWYNYLADILQKAERESPRHSCGG